MQGIIRGIQFRQNFRSNNTNSMLNPSFNMKIVIQYLILKTEESVKLLFKKYSPLNDTFKAELRNPFVDKNTVYYGEWYYFNNKGRNPKTNKKHGRGIQTWTNGSYYEGYWREDKTYTWNAYSS